jgi:tetratricopeptide (TPR) repeat protein
MINRKGIALAAMLLTIVVYSPLMAQRPSGNPRNADARGGQRGAGPAPVDYRPKAQSPEEFQAFQAINTEASPANKVTLADTFLTTYPNSNLSGYVQRFRMEAFTRLGKYKEAVVAGEAGLNLEMKYLESLIAKADAEAAAAKNAPKDNKKPDKNAPPPPAPIDKNSDAFKQLVDETNKAMLYYYQNLMSNYQSLNDAQKTIEWAQKALNEQPEDLLTLLTLSSVMAARPSTDPKELDKQMKEAEEHGKKALTQVNALLASPMAAQMRPEDKAGLTATVHQTLGRIYYNTKKYPESQREYGAAIVAKKDDGDSYFYLGLALAQDKPPKVDDAMESLAKAVFLGGATKSQADDVLKQLYQNARKAKGVATDKLLEGYDQFIKDAGAKIGK